MSTALITGATAGIGAAFASRLAADRFDLVLVARDASRLEESAATLRRDRGVQVEVISADLGTDEGIARVERRVSDGVDLLINNAGYGLPGKFLEVPVADEVAMLRVHCEAVLRLTTSALEGMVVRKRGGVINVSSVGAFVPRGTYGASKAWVISFTEGIAKDLAGTGVRVMALCPGFVHTEFHDRSKMDISGIPEFMWLEASELVDLALRDFRKGAVVSIPSVRYKAIVALTKFAPRGLVGKLSTRTGR